MKYNTLQDILEIFIITYNRAKRLDETFHQILADVSPIKELSITVIDNNSTDDTTLIVQKWQAKYPNIKYCKNKYNIGANANIVKAFYKANKDYVWILADKDYYNWNSWSEVEKGISDGKDAIFVSIYENPELDVAQLFIQTTFLPGVIYKTSLIDDTVMGNMEFNISNMFPHLALSAKLINEHKDIAIVKNEIVTLGDNCDENNEYSYTRGYDQEFVHPLQKDMNWLAGYANSVYLIKDKKIRNYIVQRNRYCAKFTSAQVFFFNKKESNGNMYNLACIFSVLNFFDKLKFILNIILVHSIYLIAFIHKEEKYSRDNTEIIVRYKIRIFNCIKTKLFEIKKKVKRSQM